MAPLHAPSSSRPTPELMPLRVDQPTFLGILTCSRRCWGCRLFAVVLWLMTFVAAVGFVALMVAAAVQG